MCSKVTFLSSIHAPRKDSLQWLSMTGALPWESEQQSMVQDRAERHEGSTAWGGRALTPAMDSGCHQAQNVSLPDGSWGLAGDVLGKPWLERSGTKTTLFSLLCSWMEMTNTDYVEETGLLERYFLCRLFLRQSRCKAVVCIMKQKLCVICRPLGLRRPVALWCGNLAEG